MVIYGGKDDAAKQFNAGLLEWFDLQTAMVGNDNRTHQSHVKAFAVRVFINIDNEYRECHANKQTAEIFFAAMCFTEVCTVFGPL